MTTVAYLAVSPRAAPTATACSRRRAVPGLRRFTEAVHEAGCRGRRPDRPRRTGGQRPLQPGAGAGPVPAA